MNEILLLDKQLLDRDLSMQKLQNNFFDKLVSLLAE